MKSVVVGAFALALLLLMPLSVYAKKAGKAQYPVVCGFEGDPRILQNGTLVTGNLENKILREKILVQTDAKSKICIELSANMKVTVFAETSFFIPAIEWENGKVEEIQLSSGKILVSKSAGGDPVRLSSSLYREEIPQGQFVFEYYPDEANFRASVLDGTIKFRGLETEVSSVLSKGETQVFLGEIQEGQIQYDILLGGRKVARGQLGSKSKLSDADLKKLVSYFEIKKKRKVVAKPEEPMGIAASKGRLCRKPYGGFNECLFRCRGNAKGRKICEIELEKVSCVRLRCLANGEWGDEFIYPKSKAPCQAADFVKACDY